MRTRRWLVVLGGTALVAFTASPVFARQGSDNAGIREPGAMVLAGDNEPGPDADWVEVPSGSSQSENGGDSAQTGNGEPIAAGPDTAPVTIVEYGDYACPYCRGEEPTLHELRRRYGGQVRIVFRDFPLKIHPGAMEAAMAARCAEEQGAFQQYHDALYTGRYGFSRPQLEALAGSLGLDTAAFSACLDAEGSRRLVTREIAQAQRLGVHVTPTFLIDGQRLVGEQSISSFESVINAQLAAHR